MRPVNAMRPSHPRHDVWALGVVLTLAMTAASVFQYVVGALAPNLTADLRLSRLGLGGMTAAYYIAAAVSSALLARRVDRISARVGTFLLYGVSAAACAFGALLASAWGLILAAAVGGLAAGLSNPVTNLVLAARPGHRGALVGVKQAGVQLSAVVIGTCMPALAGAVGWRMAMAVLALILVSGGLATVAAAPLRGPRPGTMLQLDAGLPGALPWLCGYALFMGAGMSTINTYLVLYGHDQVGLRAGTAGLLLATVGLAGGCARVVSSVLAERGERLHMWLTAGAALAVAGVVIFASSRNTALVWVGVVIVGVSGAAWNGVAMLAVLRASPAGRTGHATGLVLTGFFVGLSLGPLLFGGVVDAMQSYAAGWLLTASCFALAGVLAIGMSRIALIPRAARPGQACNANVPPTG